MERDSPRSGRAVRGASALLAVGFAAAACFGSEWIGGEHGFGFLQGAALLAAGVLAASCLAPLAWNAKILALAVSTSLALLVAELGLRLALGPRYYPPFQLDAQRIYTLVPGATREYRRAPINGGERVLYRVNEAGFRGEELAAEPGGARIVVYGDSFIQAEYSALPQTFAERLERRVSEQRGEPVEVVNAGVAGYGPDQILRRIEAELAELHPDLVLVALYAGNDFGDLVRNKLYRLDANGSLRENAFRLSPELAKSFSRSRREPILRKVAREAARSVLGEAAVFDASATARLARMDGFLAQSQAEYREHVVEGDDVVRELLRDPYNADVSLVPDSDSARYKVALMDRVVAALKARCEARGVPLALVLIPHPIDVDEHESGAVDTALHPGYARSRATDELARIAVRQALPYVDLFAPFREHGGRALYFRGVDDHWNDRGQDLAAALVADSVTAGHLLRQPAP